MNPQNIGALFKYLRELKLENVLVIFLLVVIGIPVWAIWFATSNPSIVQEFLSGDRVYGQYGDCYEIITDFDNRHILANYHTNIETVEIIFVAAYYEELTRKSKNKLCSYLTEIEKIVTASETIPILQTDDIFEER